MLWQQWDRQHASTSLLQNQRRHVIWCCHILVLLHLISCNGCDRIGRCCMLQHSSYVVHLVVLLLCEWLNVQKKKKEV